LKTRVAVVGGGIFGAMTANRLAEAGRDVTLFERRADLLEGASFNNQNRLHLGFHYPRDEKTARQCIRGFKLFCAMFPSAILDGAPNAYFIASECSRTTPEAYLAFADRLGLKYERLDLAKFSPRVQNVDLGISVEEVIYDCAILRVLMSKRLLANGVQTRLGVDVRRVVRTPGGGFTLVFASGDYDTFDAVVDCTYAETGALGSQLGHSMTDLQYEYTVIPIMKWDRAPVGITVMDGPFMTVLPFGKTGDFLLYHVEHSVLTRIKSTRMPPDWRDPETAPAAVIDLSFVKRMMKSCEHFVDLQGMTWTGRVLEGPRVVLPNRDATDERLSIVRKLEPGFVTVFSGKIDHCTWAADEVVEAL
jgi:glycine/D-amino acid oxidase-like deaminating enzyme